MALSTGFINKIRSCGIVEYASQYTKLKRVGNVLQGHCPHPDHQDSDPSFTIWTDEKTGLESWCCLGCHHGKKDIRGRKNFGSDNIAFVQWMSSHSKSSGAYGFREAVAVLAKFYGIPMEQPQNQEKLNSNKTKAITYYQTLTKHPEAISYLIGRGLDAEDISKWVIGYDAYHERITFPIISRDKEVLGFSNRYIGKSQDVAKYWNDPKNEVFDKGSILYGIQYLDAQSPYIIITEGQFDAILAHKYGLTNTVASMTCSLTDKQIEIILKTGKVPIICYDSDSAGQKGANAVLQNFYKAGCRQMEILPMPVGTDMADLANNLKERLPEYVEKHRTSYARYILGGLADIIDQRMTELQLQVMPEVEKALQCISDPEEMKIMRGYIKKRLHLWVE